MGDELGMGSRDGGIGIDLEPAAFGGLLAVSCLLRLLRSLSSMRPTMSSRGTGARVGGALNSNDGIPGPVDVDSRLVGEKGTGAGG